MDAVWKWYSLTRLSCDFRYSVAKVYHYRRVGSDLPAVLLHSDQHQAEWDNEEILMAAKWGDSGVFGAAKGAETKKPEATKRK